MAEELAGKVVVITGGGQGIGAATASALSRLGAKVVIGDLDQVRAEKTAGELDAEALPLDVTDIRGFTEFLDEVERRHGRIDVLVNNAGIMPLARLEEESDATTRRQLEINLHAVIHGTREAVKRMRPRRSGHIVNVASFAGKAGFPGAATYCATKHAVVGLSEAVHLELHGSGVHVSCVLPAIVRTELASGLGEAKLFKSSRPEDVADAIVSTLRKPRFEVFVPRSVGTMGKLTRLLPRRAGEALARVLKADQLLASAAHSPARAEYEARAAESAPGASQE
ncbi:SDR family oxidoreductase [Amycolatopsis sp. SID8362]|uniref:SDR family oxidoreductase n=1 Tax=Amycolatopsis sp. SID8362 TaxID=2690346 RepID=UPI001371754F|nr:SDR family oxidoreductase [Amycolatopsis sp. SID8362]NBH04841.1 SDR family NAD(P)-dependent oxidoreductase [Amycolatopsis sp. SID8362]NED41542.1 SDR family oxidoreductase [Amycolatopsis sp. SID8362]